VNWCNALPSADNWPVANPNATALPLDQNMITTDDGGRPVLNKTVAMGSGTWDCAAYWSEAHPMSSDHAAPEGCTSTATISRYQVYQYEIRSNYLRDRSIGAEIGAPRCNVRGAANRRVIYGAIVNCLSSPVPVNGDARKVPATAFGKFFLVLPANEDTNRDLYAEFIGLIQHSDNLTYDSVQLNR
jgi:hypothetical protein